MLNRKSTPKHSRGRNKQNTRQPVTDSQAVDHQRKKQEKSAQSKHKLKGSSFIIRHAKLADTV
jgi:hypothetical protein